MKVLDYICREYDEFRKEDELEESQELQLYSIFDLCDKYATSWHRIFDNNPVLCRAHHNFRYCNISFAVMAFAILFRLYDGENSLTEMRHIQINYGNHKFLRYFIFIMYD